MRILLASQTFPPALNGQSVFTGNLAKGLAERGHKVLVMVPSMQGPAHAAQLDGVQIQYLKSVQLNFAHSDVFITPSNTRPVKRIINSFRPDIVHIHDHYLICRSALMAARRNRVKVVGTNHFMPENIDPYIPFSTFLKPAFNWVLWHWMLELYNRLDAITAPSKTAATILAHQGIRLPVYPISCGVNLKTFRPMPDLNRQEWRLRYDLDPNRILFIFVGRVDGEKRLDVLLHALHLLARDDIQLAVIGNGAAKGGLNHLAKELNLGQSLRFTGFVPNEDLPALLNCADIFVMPSEAELLSIATLEAMATCKPILAARAKALPELVTENINGYLFQPGNAADAARNMALLADHPEAWESMGAASYEKVQQHSLDHMLESYETIYEALLAEMVPIHFRASAVASKKARKPLREPIGPFGQ